MKSERRHELQQDELSVQIEKVSESVKQNAATIIGVVVAVVAILAAGAWFMNQRTTAKNEAYATLFTPTATNEDPAAQIAEYRQVAKDNVTPAITVQAWMNIGDTALQYIYRKRPETEAPDPEKRAKMLTEAEEAFNKILGIAGNDLTAKGRAHIALGLIAEARGEFDAARKHYESVASGKQFELTGLQDQAQYRIDNMESWSEPITFPEPVVKVEPVDTSGTEATFDPTTIDVTDNADLEDMTPTDDGDAETTADEEVAPETETSD